MIAGGGLPKELEEDIKPVLKYVSSVKGLEQEIGDPATDHLESDLAVSFAVFPAGPIPGQTPAVDPWSGTWLGSLKAGNFYLHVLITLGIFTVLGSGINLLMGFTGQLPSAMPPSSESGRMFLLF
jgi:hypothetical protein